MLVLLSLTGCGKTANPPAPVSVGTAAAGSQTGTAAAGSQPVKPVARPARSVLVGTPDATAPAPPAAATTSPPVSLDVPAIAVSSSLQALGVEKDGTLQAPTKWEQAGWYAGGVIPGDPGPAVIAGHVDSVSGPAVFFRLKQLKAGDMVMITQRNHHVLKFQVDTVAEYPKNQFPTAAVYGPTPLPVLRLITCTGDFDSAKHSYVDNLVVTSHLSS